MKMIMYSIYDSAVECFARPMFVNTQAQIMRMLKDEMENADSSLAKHPYDYALFRVGEFNDSDGIVTPLLPAQHVCSLIALKQGDLFPDDGEVEQLPLPKSYGGTA